MKPSPEAMKRYNQQREVRKNRDHLESKRQKKILDYLNSITGCKFYLSANAGGEADIHGSYHGKYMAIEVKRPGKKLKKLQESEARDVRATGGFSFRAENVKQVEVILAIVNMSIYERIT